MPPYIPDVVPLAKIFLPARSQDLYPRLRALFDRIPHTKLLSVLKFAVYLVLLLNFKSLPCVWHARVFWRPVLFVTNYYLLYLRLLLKFTSKKQRIHALRNYGEDLSPVGASPFEFSVLCKQWAGFDDLDLFGMHLSNSSYAKALDYGRQKVFVECFPAWFRSDRYIGLGATHYYFIREIPPLARYDIRLTIGSWDHKWLYLVARYVTRPNRRNVHKVSLWSPQYSSTPNDSPAPIQNGFASVEQAVAAINNGTGSARRRPIVEQDGAILHCVAVSQLCFKSGRITVPPAIVLALEGFTKPYGDGDCNNGDVGERPCLYSHANPPPNWVKSQSIRHGCIDGFLSFIGGKWRDIPEGERWWEDALGGSVEAKRQANLETLDSLRQALERSTTML